MNTAEDLQQKMKPPRTTRKTWANSPTPTPWAPPQRRLRRHDPHVGEV